MTRIVAILIACGMSFGLLCTTAKADSAGSAGVALRRAMPDIKFDSVGLGDVVEFLSDVSGANIHVDWKALETVNVPRDSLVTLHLRDVSLEHALALSLSEASGGGDALAFYADRNVIEITTKAESDRELFTIVIPVDDLLVDVPDFTDAPEFSLSAALGNTGGGANGNSNSNSGLFSSTTTNNEKVQTKQERADELVQLIMATIAPEVWRANGGTASIVYFHGSLIITAPRSIIADM
jgi:hypothetical protein